MWAVVEIGRKQYKVKEGDILEVERIKEKDSLTLDKVLLLCRDESVEVGTPYLKKVQVKADILGEEKGDKTIVYKYKRRKKYRKKSGHRQIFTRLKISKIAKG